MIAPLFYRHNDLHAARKDFGTFYGAEDFAQNVFPLQIKLLVSLDTNSLVVNIAKKVSLLSATPLFYIRIHALHAFAPNLTKTKNK